MATQINLTYCGMEGSGPTVKQAKADAAVKIERLLTELNQAPNLYVMQVDTWSALVARGPQGWGFRIIDCPAEPIKQGMLYLSSGYHDSDDVLRSCAHSLLQAAWTPGVIGDESWINTRQAGLPCACRGADLKADLLRWVSWQRDYKRLRDSGLSDREAHDQAQSGRTMG